MTAAAELMAQVSRVIADTTGNELEEVVADALFEDDLGMSEHEIKLVILKLNKELGIKLQLKTVLDEGIETVGEFVQMVAEETELG
jgi:acyl carrier protein